MSLLSYTEEPLSQKEIDFIENLLERDSVGYFKVMRLIILVALIVGGIIGLIATFTTPANELEQQFSIRKFIITVSFSLLLILLMLIYGKKKYSWKYKQDLKNGLKLVLLLPIQRKQYVPINQTFFFYVDEPSVKVVEVSELDFHQFEQGDLIHVEVAKYSRTYLGYF